MIHHRAVDRASVSHWLHRNEMQWVQGWSTTESWIEHLYHIGHTEMKYSGCKVGPPQRIGSSICATYWLRRNEIQWERGWSTTKSWIEHLYHTGYTEMKCSGCGVGSQQRIGQIICITSWLHRNEMQCVQSWSTTENWIEHLYHCGYTAIKCIWCKVGPPQSAGSRTCNTNWLHRN